MDDEEDFDFLLQLAEMGDGAVEANNNLPSLLVKDDDELLEEVYGRTEFRRHIKNQPSLGASRPSTNAAGSLPQRQQPLTHGPPGKQATNTHYRTVQCTWWSLWPAPSTCSH